MSPDNSFNIESIPLKTSEVSINNDLEGFFKQKTKNDEVKRLKQQRQSFIYNFILLFRTIISLLRDHFVLILASFTYMISLTGCESDFYSCIRLYKQYGVYVVYLLFLSSCLFVWNFIRAYNGYVKRYTILTEVLIIAYLCFLYDTGYSVKSHGGYNRIFLLILIVFFLVSYTVYKIVKSIFGLLYKTNRLICGFTLVLLFIISYKLIDHKVLHSCDYWDKGFKGTTIDNGQECVIRRPFICYEYILNNVLDVTWLLNYNCDNIGNNSAEVAKKYFKIGKDYTLAGYPRTEQWDFNNWSLYDVFQNNILANVVDMSDNDISQSVKDKIEAFVDFSQKPPKVDIKLKKDEQLLKRNHTEDLNAQNVIILFVDSVSRNQFKRKLTKVWGWLENYYNNTTADIESFQFLKYHAIADFTIPNLTPVFFGTDYRNGDGEEIVREFKQKGYITASTLNGCFRSFIDIAQGPSLKKKWENYDHEFHSLFCDANFALPNQNYPLLNGPFGIVTKCLYNLPTISYSLEYSRQFLNAYRDMPKFLRVGDINAHEGTGEVIKYDDEELYQFLEYLRTDGHLDNSVLIVISDHGYMMPGLHHSFKTEDHMKDLLLPFLSIVVSKKLDGYEQIKANLQNHENLLINPFYVHDTLVSILEKNNTIAYDKESLMYKRANKTTPCSDFLVNKDDCRCQVK
jgi:hypothetical protein